VAEGTVQPPSNTAAITEARTSALLIRQTVGVALLAVTAAELPVGVADEASPAGATLAGEVVDAAGVTVVAVPPGVGVADEPVGLGVGVVGVGVGVVGVGVGVCVREGLGVTRGVVVLGAGAGVVCVGEGVGVVCVGVTVGVALSDGDEVGEGSPDGM
jgi:hypothetical protein